jgi:hypothetical protein
MAKGWNICVGDLNGNWVQITTDGNHNKEPTGSLALTAPVLA